MKNEHFIKLQPILFMLIGILTGRIIFFMHRYIDKKGWIVLPIFMFVNDTYGHLGGDKALTELANILKANIRKI